MSPNEFCEVPHTIGCKIPQDTVLTILIGDQQTTQIVPNLQVWATFIGSHFTT